MRQAYRFNGKPPGRRAVLVGVAAGTAAMAIVPRRSLAAATVGDAKASLYPTKIFAQTNEAATMKMMFGKTPTPSPDVKMTAPEIAENGAVVPIAVDANMKDATTVAILAIDNPFTMAAAYKIPSGTSLAISSRIKLAKTTKVVTVYHGGDKLLSASKQVKVTLGGCG